MSSSLTPLLKRGGDSRRSLVYIEFMVGEGELERLPDYVTIGGGKRIHVPPDKLREIASRAPPIDWSAANADPKIAKTLGWSVEHVEATLDGLAKKFGVATAGEAIGALEERMRNDFIVKQIVVGGGATGGLN